MAGLDRAGGEFARASLGGRCAKGRRRSVRGRLLLVPTRRSAAGLVLLYLLSDQQGDLVRFTPFLALATLAAAAVLLRFPETRSRELETI